MLQAFGSYSQPSRFFPSNRTVMFLRMSAGTVYGAGFDSSFGDSGLAASLTDSCPCANAHHEMARVANDPMTIRYFKRFMSSR